MTENEAKAIKWIKSVRDDAVVTLDHISKNEPNVSPMLYAGRKQKAETIIKGFEELEAYRAIGTVEEIQSMKDNGAFSGVELAQIATMQMRLKDYETIGTIDKFKDLKEKNTPKKPFGVKDWTCPTCGAYHSEPEKHCRECDQMIDWQ